MLDLNRRDHCEICGCEDTKDNSLGNWLHFNMQDKVVCSRCTDDEIDRVYKLIGFSDSEIKTLRESREVKQ